MRLGALRGRRLAVLLGVVIAVAAQAGSARATTGTYSAEVLQDNPLVYYRLGDAGLGVGDATMLDSSGNGRNGTYSTAGNVTQGVSSALLSDTANTAVSNTGVAAVGSRADGSFLPTGSAPRTIEAWFRSSVQQRQTLVSYGDTSAAHAAFGLAVDNGAIIVDTFAGETHFDYSHLGGSIDGNWHHLVVTYYGAAGAAYFDGKYLGTQFFDVNTAASTPLRIGEWVDNGAQNRLVGSLDEVAVYDTALSADRIRQHYLAAGYTIPNQAPVARNDSASTPVNTPRTFNVLANDDDPDGTTPTVTTPNPSAGSGTVACQPTGSCTYTPNAGFVGADSFTYTISDGSLTASARACVIVGAHGENGYRASDFVTGFPNSCGSGGVDPIGVAFDTQGRFYVIDRDTGELDRFGAAGGVVGPATQLGGPISGAPHGLAFGADGRLYLARRNAGDVVELDPSTGAIKRVVASIGCATGLAVDPLSGDLFVSTPFCASQVFRIHDPAGASPTVTTYAPSLSPDGTKIAFASTPQPSGNPDVRVINSDGSGTVLNVTAAFHPQIDEVWDPTWSPDGTKIAFRGGVASGIAFQTRDVYVVNADGTGGLTQLTHLGDVQDAAWSPVDNRIAFTRQSTRGLYTVDAVTDVQSAVYVPQTCCPSLHEPAWSPDGTQLAVEYDFRAGAFDIARLNADGSGLTVLTSTGQNTLPAPIWSPDGTKIAFSRDYDLYTMSATTGESGGLTQISSTADREQDPWWGNVTAPVGTAPGAPTAVSASAGDASATVSWTAPASAGSSAITGYVVTPYVGTTAQTPITVGNVSSTTVSGLTNGTTYTFKVAARNAVGTGPDSEASNAVTPQAAAGGKTLTVAINGQGHVTSTPAGIDCPGTCSVSVPSPAPIGYSLTLTETPADGYRFYGWYDATDTSSSLCAPNLGPTCTISSLSADTTLRASFYRLPKPDGGTGADGAGKIVYVYMSGAFGAQSDIWIANPDGTGASDVTNGSGLWARRPALSPDGTKIAFAAKLGGIGNQDIYVVNTDGTGLTNVTSQFASQFSGSVRSFWHPSWCRTDHNSRSRARTRRSTPRTRSSRAPTSTSRTSRR